MLKKSTDRFMANPAISTAGRKQVRKKVAPANGYKIPKTPKVSGKGWSH